MTVSPRRRFVTRLAAATFILTFSLTPLALAGTPTLGRHSCVSCWDRVASCESGQRWNYDGSSGFDGGLQFLPSTWRAAGGTRYAPYAHQATRMQQIAVASSMSLSAWPVCGRRYWG